MLKKLLFPAIFSILIFQFSSPARADFQTAYQDYVFNLQQYKNAHNEFQIAKSTYQTYKTLTSQNEAVTKFKTVLKARNQVMSTYYDLLQEKLNATEGVGTGPQNTFSGVRDSEKNWLAENQTKIEATGTIEDLNDVSAEFESRHPQMDRETKQAIGTVLVAKENTLRTGLDLAIGKVTTKLGEIRNQGDDTTAADRGLISVQNKLDFQANKTLAAEKIFQGEDQSSQREKINLLSGQKTLIEANQYLKEAAGFLLEIVRSFTG